MPNCNFNCCRTGPYYPREIYTCNCLNKCSVGNIVNPTQSLEIGVFTLTEITNVISNSVIPVALSTSKGAAIKGEGGLITLTAGTYQISYNILADLPAGGEVEVNLQLNSVDIDTMGSVASGDAGNSVSLSNQIILELEQNGVLSLINSTSSAVNIITANVAINKL